MRQIIEVVDGHCQVEYPLAHVHVNAAFADGSTMGRLHIPTRRVPLELVIWHLIAEWDVAPRLDDWRGLLTQSIEGFDARRTID